MNEREEGEGVEKWAWREGVGVSALRRHCLNTTPAGLVTSPSFMHRYIPCTFLSLPLLPSLISPFFSFFSSYCNFLFLFLAVFFFRHFLLYSFIFLFPLPLLSFHSFTSPFLIMFLYPLFLSNLVLLFLSLSLILYQVLISSLSPHFVLLSFRVSCILYLIISLVISPCYFFP